MDQRRAIITEHERHRRFIEDELERLTGEKSSRAEREEQQRQDEERRKKWIQTNRQKDGVCILCGKPISFFGRLCDKTKHMSCKTFVE